MEFLAIVVLAVLAGCGGSGRPTVRGEVTFDGKPVQEGTFIGTLKGSNPTGEPLAVSEKKSIVRPGRRYSPEIGKVLACVKGSSAAYKLTGEELYVRAVVRSDKPVRYAPDANVYKQAAWCQPVGWADEKP